MTKVKGSRRKSRIGHQSSGSKLIATDGREEVPRGWIHPGGKFIETNQHWETIAEQLGGKALSGPDAGERNAHVAYALGWISLGHGGAINAIGHETTFGSSAGPAVETLRGLVAKVPHFSLRIEKQIGKLDPESGKHEDFDVREYDLDLFIRRGRLRAT